MSTVLIAGHAFSGLDGVRAALAQAGAAAGFAVGLEVLAEEPLKQQLAAGASLVLAYVAPAVGVGRALKAAGPAAAPAVGDLLAEWRAAGEAMLALAVRHPEHCLLVNAEAALADPARLAASAQQGLGLSFDGAAVELAVPATLPLSPLESLLADSLVAADVEAAALFIELESCAHLAHDAALPAEQRALAAWEQYQAEQVRQSHAASDRQLEEERNAQALALATREVAALEGRLQGLASDRDRHVALAVKTAETVETKESELIRQTALAQHLRREGESLLLQLHDAHLESEGYFKQVEEAKAELAQARSEVASARLEIDAEQSKLAAAQSELATARDGTAALRVQLMVHAGALQQAQERLAKLQAEHADNIARLAAQQADAEAQRQNRELVHVGDLQQAQEKLAKLQAEHVEAIAHLTGRQAAAEAQHQDRELSHASALQEAQEKLATLEAERVNASASLAALQAEAETLRQVSQDHDRTLVQLTQISADAARFQEAGELNAVLLAQAEEARRLLQRFWHEQQPDEVRIDLRRDIMGSNWYPAEGDGRWTGPECDSTITLPALRSGSYTMHMTLVGAMSPQIATGLKVELNGRLLGVTFDRAKHPRVGTATFQAPAAACDAWVLSLNVPAVETPAERGSPDRRRLGVRVAEIRFTGPLKA